MLTGFKDDVERMLSQPELDYRLFEAALAAWNTLIGNPGAGVTNPDVLIERVTNPKTPARIRGYALRLLPPAHKQLTVPLLQDLLAIGDATLSMEVVRTLATRQRDDAQVVLAEVAADERADRTLRAEAVAGLATSTKAEHRQLLLRLAGDDDQAIRDEALRALRFTTLTNVEAQSLKSAASRHPESDRLVAAALDAASINAGRPALTDVEAWLKRLDAVPGKPDPAAGRRVFFSTKMALCSTCHRHSGRGNVVGPDLSFVSRQGDRAAILRSILEPNREVAPQFYPTQLRLQDGSDFVGILLRSSSTEVYRDITGKERTFQKSEIKERQELKSSLMPTGLVGTLTDAEVRDLLAFLMGE